MGIVKYTHIEKPTGLIVIENGKPVLKAYKDGVNDGAFARNYYHIDEVLANNSWEIIRLVCEAGDANNYWTVGDEKTDVGADGVTRTFRISDMSGLYGKHVVFEEKDCEPTKAGLNPRDNRDEDGCYGVYNISKMRTETLPSVLNLFSILLRGNITDTTYKVAKSARNTTVLSLTDKLFLPAERELYGVRKNSIPEEYDVLSWYQLYANNNVDSFHIKNVNGVATNWWLRSPKQGYSDCVCYVKGTDGKSDYNQSYYSYGVSPVFAF